VGVSGGGGGRRRGDYFEKEKGLGEKNQI